MSVEAVQGFIEKLGSDETLLAQLGETVQANQGGDVASAVSRLGASHGFNFTAEEAKAAGDAMRVELKKQSGGELSEEELETVAGGFFGAAVGMLARRILPSLAGQAMRGGNPLGQVSSAASRIPVIGGGVSQAINTVSSFFSGW